MARLITGEQDGADRSIRGLSALAVSAEGVQLGGMWIDERGSEVLDLAECRRLLALGAAQGRHGHLGIPGAGAPVVQPSDYAVHGHDVVIRIGDELSARLDGQLVAFQVDGTTVSGIADQDDDAGPRWSVLVRGLALEEDRASLGGDVPAPEVAQPGRHVIRIRADVVTGRRLAPASEENVP